MDSQFIDRTRQDLSAMFARRDSTVAAQNEINALLGQLNWQASEYIREISEFHSDIAQMKFEPAQR